MEKRFTGLLIPILIATLVYLLFFANGPGKEPPVPTPEQDPSRSDPAVQKAIENQPSGPFDPEAVVDHVFGELDQDGFHVHWSLYGAGVRSITLNDHYVSPASARKSDKRPADYYPIVPAYVGSPRPWGFGLVLEGRGVNRFSKAIDDGPKNQRWEVKKSENEVVFTLALEADGLVLEKVFTYEPPRRDLQLTINLKREGTRANDAPREYAVRLRGVHIWNPTEEHFFGQNPAIAVGSVVSGGEQFSASKSAAEAVGVTLLRPDDGFEFEFAGATNRFFGGFLYPDPNDEAAARAVTSVDCWSWPPADYHFPHGGPTIGRHSVPEIYCNLNLAVPAEGQVTSLSYRLYLGPKTSSIFDDAEQPDYARFDAVMALDFTPGCCCPIPGVSQLARALVWLLSGFHSLVGNWGVAIIMLTLLVRMTLSPLNFNMQRTMRAHGAKMAKLKPQLDNIQKQYKDDPKKLQMEMMRFNKEHKLLTAPLKGCLPILVTMPIWFGLFTALRVMYELRGEAFFGWIDDLSKPDALFPLGLDLGIVTIPDFNLLPLLMVGLWLYLQMGTPLPKDPQQRQMMVIMRFMPLMMGVMLYKYASGLMIYMCTSSIWGIIEQKITKKILGPVSPDAVGPGTMPMM